MGTMNTIGVTYPTLTMVITSTLMPGVVVTLPSVTSVPISPRPTIIIMGDYNPLYIPSFIIPLVTMDYRYGMPTSMMAGLDNHASMFAYNDATIASPLNPYLASGSSISNHGHIGQPRGGFIYAFPIVPTLTTHSLATMRTQLDESNHEMMNI